MMNGNKMFGIYIISYNRADEIKTHKFLEYYKVVIRESEKDKYLKVIPEENLLPVPDGEICGFTKVMNWVIENAEEDVIVILDDDIEKFQYRLEYNSSIEDNSIITEELERVGQLIFDLDIGLASVDVTPAPWNYRSEFEFTGTSGGCRWFNRSIFKSRYTTDIGDSCDFDVVFQELIKNRIILKPKYFTANAMLDLNKGGITKSRQGTIDSYKAMKIKWGKYFAYNLKQNKAYIKVKR